jgi:exopolysaccharide production protein ExoQ
MARLPTLLEKGFVVFSLFISTTALIPVLLDSEQATSIPNDPYSPILFMGIYAVTIVLIGMHWNSFALVATKDIWIWLLLGIALASISWTVAPDITPRRSFLLLGTSLFGIYLAMRFTLREQLQLCAWAFGFLVVLSFVFALAHKNILGRVIVLASQVFLFVALGKPRSNRTFEWLAWGGYGLSVALVVLSTSKTSLISFIILTIIFFLYRTCRLNYSQLIPLGIVIVLVVGGGAILVIDNTEAIALSTGRDLTLTGRTEIWGVMLEKIAERPLTGYGLNAFWRDWDSPVTADVWRQLAWECPYGHNGFMDLLVELGIPGLVVFLGSYFTTFVRGVNLLRMTGNVEGIWYVMYLTFLLIYNISESTLVATNSIFWVLYVSAIFSLAINFEQSRGYQPVMVIDDEWI